MIMRTNVVPFWPLVSSGTTDAFAGLRSDSPVSYDYPWCVRVGSSAIPGDAHQTRDQCWRRHRAMETCALFKRPPLWQAGSGAAGLCSSVGGAAMDY